jgi:ABC-type oligopeptide transport system substrate-binding subunit
MDLKLEPVEAHKLRDDVEQYQNYDLAYYYHDYPSEAFWLWPLFDPNSIDPGGSNYMGVLESDLTSLLSRAMNSRNFGHVQETMRMIHRMLDKKMPLIPLWQLDTIIAHRKELKATPFDPLLLFRDVEHWTKGAP